MKHPLWQAPLSPAVTSMTPDPPHAFGAPPASVFTDNLTSIAGSPRLVTFFSNGEHVLLWKRFSGTTGTGDGTGTNALINAAKGPSCDANGNIYFADHELHTIRKCTPAGVVTTIAGAANQSGSNDGNGSAARFFNPSATAVAPDGTLFVLDSGNHLVRRISTAGVVTTIGGLAGRPASDLGNQHQARFNNPLGIAVGSNQEILVADTNNHRITRGLIASLPKLIAANPSGTHLPPSGHTIPFAVILPRTQSQSQAITFHNVGYADLSILSITFNGPGQEAFSASLSGNIIPENTSRPLTFQFIPPSAGIFEALATIHSNDPEQPTLSIRLTGTANTPPTFAGYSITCSPQETVSLSLQKILAAANDPDAHPLTPTLPSSSSLRGGPLNLTSNYLTYIAPADLGEGDRFDITLTDPFGQSVQARITVIHRDTNAISSTNPPQVTRHDDGTNSVRFNGIPGRAYLVQRSDDLGTWTTLATLTASSIGIIQWTDPSPPPSSAFYRVATP